ncbi:hypothetical protein [Ralstonia sp. R-29]
MKRILMLVLVGAAFLAGCQQQSWDEKKEEAAKAEFLGKKK